MLNFVRDTFDEWLCILAQDYGAEFRDGCRFKDFEETEDGILVNQTSKNQQAGILSFETNEELQAYLDAGMLKMGLNMFVQRLLNRLRSAERQVMLP